MIQRAVDYICAPENADKRKKIFYIILVVVLLADIPVHREHVSFVWDRMPGWSAFYGFISCVLIIAVFKFLGHVWLLKKEDYYD